MSSSIVLKDRFGRVHRSLRVSVTDRCNLRCSYCMPEHDPEFAARETLLSFEEIHRVVDLLVRRAGIRKVRLTGGEPLLRKELWRLVEKLASINGLDDLALTTNAALLAKHARKLRDAGLRRLNISLDTLDRDRFIELTRRDRLAETLQGIQAAIEVGFDEIKLNTLAIAGAVEDELVDLVKFATDRGIEIRFIEFMPLDADGTWKPDSVLAGDRILEILSKDFPELRPVAEERGTAPAERFSLGKGSVGIIRSVTRPFCESCDRLRLSADGAIRNCLFAHQETSIRDLLRSSPGRDGNGTGKPDRTERVVRNDGGGSNDHAERHEIIDEKILDAFMTNIQAKGPGHEMNHQGFRQPERPMYSIGG